MNRLTLFSHFAVVFAVSLPALGDVESPKIEARALTRRALALEAQGRCAEAVPLFRRAYNLVPVPTLALFEGRCRERMRQLIEAEERYSVAAAFPPGVSSPPPLARAVSEAKQRLVSVRPRIPRIIIEDRNAHAAVWLDGQNAHGSTLAVNPGRHEIAWGSPRKSRRLELGEGERRRLTLSEGTSTHDFATYAAFGVGLLGVGTGVAAAVLAANKKADADDGCLDKACTAKSADALDDYRTLRRVSTWSTVAGAVGLGVGGVLLVARPTHGGASVGARGTF